MFFYVGIVKFRRNLMFAFINICWRIMGVFFGCFIFCQEFCFLGVVWVVGY